MSLFAVRFAALKKNAVIIFHIFIESFLSKSRCEEKRIERVVY